MQTPSKDSKLLLLGTKVFGFLDCPFRVTDGMIIEYSSYPKTVKFPPTRYRCQMYDPHTKEIRIESYFWVYLSSEEAIKAHKEICDILYKNDANSN